MMRAMNLLSAAFIMAAIPALADDGRSNGRDNAPLSMREEAEASQQVRVNLDADARAAVEGINAFSLDLYKEMIRVDQNLFVSPASVAAAMGLAYRGAEGETAREIAETFHFPFAPNRYLASNSAVIDSLNFSRPNREMATANAVWTDESVLLRADYEADLATFARAGLRKADFRNAPDASRKEINRWVEEITHDRIKDLLGESDVTEGTSAVLVNAIYWKGLWSLPFDLSETRLGIFRKTDGAKVETPLMYQKNKFAMIEEKGFKAISLPYSGGEMEMLIFLPDRADGLAAFEADLTPAKLTEWIDRIKSAEYSPVKLTLPKMKLEMRAGLEGKLQAMGLKTAFSESANFCGMTQPGGRGPLAFNRVIHQTLLEADEKGSEAAAATAISMIIISSARREPPPPPPKTFRADHPFLFLIRDQRTGLITFMGRMIDPTVEQAQADELELELEQQIISPTICG